MSSSSRIKKTNHASGFDRRLFPYKALSRVSPRSISCFFINFVSGKNRLQLNAA
uniref:Uncharacterized protein n=1 Tax=Ascaris lumbricoides TaxID=6252 RepID=A0A0M3IWD3_ASCLU